MILAGIVDALKNQSVLVGLVLLIIGAARYWPTHWRDVAESGEKLLAQKEKRIQQERQEKHELKTALESAQMKTDLSEVMNAVRENQSAIVKLLDPIHRRKELGLDELQNAIQGSLGRMEERQSEQTRAILKALAAIEKRLNGH